MVRIEADRSWLCGLGALCRVCSKTGCVRTFPWCDTGKWLREACRDAVILAASVVPIRLCELAHLRWMAPRWPPNCLAARLAPLFEPTLVKRDWSLPGLARQGRFSQDLLPLQIFSRTASMEWSVALTAYSFKQPNQGRSGDCRFRRIQTVSPFSNRGISSSSSPASKPRPSQTAAGKVTCRLEVSFKVAAMGHLTRRKAGKATGNPAARQFSGELCGIGGDARFLSMMVSVPIPMAIVTPTRPAEARPIQIQLNPLRPLRLCARLGGMEGWRDGGMEGWSFCLAPASLKTRRCGGFLGWATTQRRAPDWGPSFAFSRLCLRLRQP